MVTPLVCARVGRDRHLISTNVSDELLEHDCPRCARSVRQRYYGPCPDCRTDLAARFAGRAREVEVGEYEPKMNVTPNAVALRDE